jgi:hypothetical protein
MCFRDAKKFKTGKLTDLRGVSNPDMNVGGKLEALNFDS